MISNLGGNIERALEKERRIGEEQGRKLAKKFAQVQMAKKMIENNFDNKKIEEITGLLDCEIEAIRNVYFK